MVLGTTAPPGMPPKNYAHTYVHDQLAGHSLNNPWWATPLAWVIILALLLFLAALTKWL